jgi:4-amino-4-deoxy-L-arabinose transferase-like glycosyltransferase
VRTSTTGPALIERLSRQTSLLLVLGLYFLVNVAVRLILPHGLELDEAEQTFVSQWLIPGYGSQPPFYNWLQHGAIALFGMSLATLAGLKNLMLFAAYALYYLAARQVLRNKGLAAVAALGLLTLPQVSFEAQRDLSHTVAATFGASFFLYALLRVLKSPSLVAFLVFGLATGIGGITKYNFAILPVAAGLAVLCDADMRRRVLDWRLIPAALLAVLIVAPHALWLVDNFDAASGRTLGKLVNADTGYGAGVAKGIGSLALAFLSFTGLPVVVFTLVYRERLGAIIKASNPWTRLLGRTVAFSVVLILLMIVFAGFENVRDRWMTPILLGFPLYLALKIDAADIPSMPHLRRVWAVALAVMILVPSILLGRVAIDRVAGEYGYVNIPFGRLAQTVAEKAADADTVVVAADGHLAGNMHYNLPDIPVVTPQPPTAARVRPLSSYDRVVLVWRRTDGSAPKSFEETFGTYLNGQGVTVAPQNIAIVGYPYAWGRPADQYRFAYAVIDLKQ